MTGDRMEIPKTRTDAELLDDLAAFDRCLQDRVTEIQNGLSPNGQNPDGVLTDFLAPTNPKNPKEHVEAENALIKEYEWAIALFGYAYGEMVDPVAFRAAAEEGLFLAGESYDEEKEPDFLKHLTGELGNYLFVVFGEEVPEEDMRKIPTLDEFEILVQRVHPPVEEVVEETEPEEPTPAPDEDEVDDDETADILVEDPELEQPPVRSPKLSFPDKRTAGKPLPSLAEVRAARESAETSDEDAEKPLPEPRLPHERVMDEFRIGHKVLILVGTELQNGVITDVETYDYPFVSSLPIQAPLSEIEALSGVGEKKLKALRQEPRPEELIKAMLSRPDLHRFIPPSGFLRIMPERGPTGIVIDSNRSEIIPLKAWERIMDDEEYRDAWLASGPAESLRLRSVFEHAMERRHAQDRIRRVKTTQLDQVSESGRARLRSTRTDRETGALLHTATGN